VSDVYKIVPDLDTSKCDKCGLCADVCKPGAVVKVNIKYPIFFEDQCSSCKACFLVCPHQAILEKKQLCGYVYQGMQGNLELLSGEMLPVQMEGVTVIKKAKEIAAVGKEEFIIYDTAAGTHCPVIHALMGVDLVLAVTEPTPLGAHDLGLILSLTQQLGIPTGVVLNKHGIGNDSLIKDLTDSNGSTLFGTLPYSKEIITKYSRGEPIDHPKIRDMTRKLEAML
jgi:MinD superfamily P-loop ATPase